MTIPSAARKSQIPRRAIQVLTALLALTVVAAPSMAADWNQFRGPQANGVVEETGLPLRWDATTNVRWKIPNPGEGWSSPIVVGDKLFLTAAQLVAPPTGASARDARPEPYRGGGGRRRSDLTDATYRWQVYCLDASTGEVLWKRTAREGNPPIPRHSSNTYASETPVTDGRHVYAYFGMTGLYCYDFDGHLIWEKNLGVFPMRAGWGTSSSPVLHDGRLFLQIDSDGDSFVVALDARTGDEVWRAERDEMSQWSSPIIWTNSQRAELITGGMVTRSYDPATGNLLWSLEMGGGRSSASPLADGDRLYVGNELRNRGGPDDGGGAMFAVRAGAAGNITPVAGESTSSGVIWKCPRSGLEMASPVLCQGFLYMLDRRSGILTCVDAESGEVAYRQRIPRADAFWASPWVYDDKVFCLDDKGTTHVLAPGPEFKVLATNTIDEQFWATASAGNGCLFLRGADYLYCIADAAGDGQ